MKTKHTPTPWHIGIKPGPFIYGPKGEQIADLRADLLTKEENTANLLHIVKCVNAHDKLLKACKAALDTDIGDFLIAEKMLRSAIEKAEGK